MAGFLAERGAAGLEHPGGTLLAHLERVRDTLAEWGARPELCLAGLAHAVYGTDGFPHPLVGPGERAVVVELLGVEAEAIVYAYGACDREFTHPQLVGDGPVRLRDRFTGQVVEIGPGLVRDLVELTYANELDVLTHSAEIRELHGRALKDFLASCGHRASPKARIALYK